MEENKFFWSVQTDKFSGFLYSLSEVVQKIQDAEWAEVEKIPQRTKRSISQ